jgi:hypothetical protein
MTDIRNLEKTLWTAADKMRSNMDAAEYKHVVLGLIFLKYISDAFSDLHDKVAKRQRRIRRCKPRRCRRVLWHTTFFSCLKKHVGNFCKTEQSNPNWQSSLTMQWMKLKKE